MGKFVPNTFQTFNEYVDELMALLTPEEYKCLIFAARHTLGWQDRINARLATISLTMFETGYTTEGGAIYGGTGMSRATIIRACDALDYYRVLIKVGAPTSDGQKYELSESPDIIGLKQRATDQKEAARNRTRRGAHVSKAKRDEKRATSTSDAPVGSTSDVPGEAVRPTYQKEYVGRTGSGTSDVLNQSHPQNHLQSHRDQGTINDETVAIIASLYEQTFGGVIAYKTSSELIDMAKEYPLDWLRQAFAITKERAARSLRYTQTILDGWNKNGKDGKPQTDSVSVRSHAATNDLLGRYTAQFLTELSDEPIATYLIDHATELRRKNWLSYGKRGWARQLAEARIADEVRS